MIAYHMHPERGREDSDVLALGLIIQVLTGCFLSLWQCIDTLSIRVLRER